MAREGVTEVNGTCSIHVEDAGDEAVVGVFTAVRMGGCCCIWGTGVGPGAPEEDRS